MSGTVNAPPADDLFGLVKTLTELPGPTGQEGIVQEWIAARWGRFAQETQRTSVDNVLAKVGGSGPRLLLLAHADEVCLLVKSIHDDGFLHLWPYYADTLGKPPGWFIPINQAALILADPGMIEGVIATASGHVVGGQRGKKEGFEWNDWFVDAGFSSRAEAEAAGIHPGCRVIWNPPTRRLGRSRIVGKAMDDRVALAIATLAGESLAGREDLAYEVWLGSAVQEENGLIGASSMADEMRFDRCLAIDVGLTGDIPGPDARDFPSKLGAGPILVYKDSSCHYSPALTGELAALAQREGLPLQRAIFTNYGSDGAAMLRRGVETALLTYPTRYTHSPIETVDEADVRACVDLIVAFAVESRGLRVHQGSDLV